MFYFFSILEIHNQINSEETQKGNSKILWEQEQEPYP